MRDTSRKLDTRAWIFSPLSRICPRMSGGMSAGRDSPSVRSSVYPRMTVSGPLMSCMIIERKSARHLLVQSARVVPASVVLPAFVDVVKLEPKIREQFVFETGNVLVGVRIFEIRIHGEVRVVRHEHGVERRGAPGQPHEVCGQPADDGGDGRPPRLGECAVDEADTTAPLHDRHPVRHGAERKRQDIRLPRAEHPRCLAHGRHTEQGACRRSWAPHRRWAPLGGTSCMRRCATELTPLGPGPAFH